MGTIHSKSSVIISLGGDSPRPDTKRRMVPRWSTVVLNDLPVYACLGFIRLIPSIVKIGSAPHPNIRKLREVAYFHNTNKSIYQQQLHAVTQVENNSACKGKGQDIISILSKLGLSQDGGMLLTCCSHGPAK